MNREQYKIKISESKIFFVIKLVLLGITGILSLLFIVLLIAGGNLPIDLQVLLYIELFSIEFYLIGIASIMSFFLTIKFLGVDIYKQALFEFNDQGVTIITKKKAIEISGDKLFKIVVTNYKKKNPLHNVELITNNYVRRFQLLFPEELIKELKKSVYSDRFEDQ